MQEFETPSNMDKWDREKNRSYLIMGISVVAEVGARALHLIHLGFLARPIEDIGAITFVGGAALRISNFIDRPHLDLPPDSE